VPVFFEKTQRGEATILSIYGTKDEIAQFADELKEGVAFHDIRRDAPPRIRTSHLRSSFFEDVEVLVVDEGQMQTLRTSERRKKLLIWAVWILLVTVVIVALYAA
jgi:hypothetical protein